MNKLRRDVLKYLRLPLLCAPLGVAGAAAAASKAKPAQPVKLALVEGLSGAFAKTGDAVFRNLLWATERVNAGGGVRLADGRHELVIERYDRKGLKEEVLSALRAAIDHGARISGRHAGKAGQCRRGLRCGRPGRWFPGGVRDCGRQGRDAQPMPDEALLRRL